MNDEKQQGLIDAVIEAIRKMDYDALQKLNAFIAGLEAQRGSLSERREEEK